MNSRLENSEYYDVIIIGTGPAGIFTALELLKFSGKNIHILMLESGSDLASRVENRNTQKSDVMQGWGGAGAFSDGKLTLTADIGGHLSDYITLNKLEEFISEVEETYIRFGASKDRLVTGEGKLVDEARKTALKYGITLIPYRLLHIGTDKCSQILLAMYDHLKASKQVKVKFNELAKNLLIEDNRVRGVKTNKGIYKGKFVIIATGRSGAAWARKESLRIGLSLENNPVDIGVRIELPAEISSHLTDLLYEFKAKFYSPTFEQECRTFCVCPNGIVTQEVVYDPETREKWITVNGHSYSSQDKETRNTNFALLVSSRFTEPFDDPLAYGRSISKLANLLTKGNVIIQRLADLKRGRRSNVERIKRSTTEPTLKEAIPGDLSFVLPYRHLCSILEMIEALDHIMPGVNSSNTLLYGIETKYYSSKIKVSDTLETKITGLYAVGDGAGVTRSLVQASISGLIAGRAIKENITKLSQEKSVEI
ncbi:MAG: NAD(P)/FAD-dependent oxidoreductase [Candidatus Hodarchaeales archaeon]